MRRRVWMVLLVGLVLLAKAVDYPAVYEDTQTLSVLGQPMGTTVARPLTAWTWQAQASLGGGLRAFHAGNIAVHLLNGWLVAEEAAWWGATPWLAAGLFVLHPLAMSATVYLSGRADLLMTLCLLLALRATRRSGPWGGVGVFAALAGALMAKEAAVAGFLLVPWTHPRRWRIWLVPLGGVAVVGAVLFWNGLSLAGLNAQAGVDQVPYTTAQAWGAWHLLARTIVPWHLAVEHDWWSINEQIRYASLIGWVVLWFAVMAWRLQRPCHPGVWALGWIWFAALPRLVQRIPMSVIGEHQWYLMLPAGAIGLAWLIERVAEVVAWLRAIWELPVPAYGRPS